jgi:hypothetical protein
VALGNHEALLILTNIGILQIFPSI